MCLRWTFILSLGISVIIPSVASAVAGVTCSGSSSYFCALTCSQCSPLGGFSCTGEICSLAQGVKSGDLHWRPRAR